MARVSCFQKSVYTTHWELLGALHSDNEKADAYAVSSTADRSSARLTPVTMDVSPTSSNVHGGLHHDRSGLKCRDSYCATVSAGIETIAI